MYGTSELYQSSLRQLPRFGYAAYSLTVIPYMIMSLVNLVATACEPQYSTMFLLRYTDAPLANLPTSTDVESVPGREAPSERATASRNGT